jgi:membrane fusion protein (multidrug efflux system)
LQQVIPLVVWHIPVFRRILPAVIVLAFVTGCDKKAAAPPPSVDVSVIKVVPKPATVTADYVAQTEAFNSVEIRPRVGGILEQVLAVEGAQVKKGQVLFIVDPQPYEVAVAQARASLAQAQASYAQSQRDLARVKPLSLIDAVSQQELDAAIAKNDANKALVDAADATLKSAQLNLGYTRVTSPIDGTMSRALFKVGGLLTAYTSLLTTVYDSDPMYVNFSISEQRMLAVQRQLNGPVDQTKPARRTFRLQLADGSDYTQPGMLNFIDPAIDARTGTLAVRLTVPNPQGLLHAGQFARVFVAIDQLDAALLVPQRAPQQLQGKDYLWVVDTDGTAQQRDVKLGPRVGDETIIESGLNAGDTVIVDGVQRLRPGTKVNVTPVAAAPGKPA